MKTNSSIGGYLAILASLALLPGCSGDNEGTDATAADIVEVATDQGPDGMEETAASCEPKTCHSSADCPSGCLCSTEGTCTDGKGIRFDLNAGDSYLVYRNDTGRADIHFADGRWIARGATARVMVDATDVTGTALTVSASKNRVVEQIQDQKDSLGTADRLVIRADGILTGVELVWTLSAYRDEGFFTFSVEVVNQTEDGLLLAKASAFEVRGEEDGGLFLGEHPSTHRILENGSWTYFEFNVDVVPGDVEQNTFYAAAVPGHFEGHSVSNIDHAVLDLASGASWIAGGLTFEYSMPVMNISYDPDRSINAPDGRTGFSYFSSDAAYRPLPKPVPAKETSHRETLYIHPTESSLHDGIEGWATAVKHHNGIVLWTEKAQGNRVPNGWNSWSTSGSTGGYGTNINEEVILENLDVMADEFLDWGMDWFQIDDGYEPAYGDWWWREDRFPHGPAWLSQQIRDRGFKPGLWMATFTAHDDSQLVADHPDWFAGTDLLPSEYNILDLTHPEVKQYLADLFQTFKNEWGFEWFKMDFSYHALLGSGFHDPSQTREEAYRGACRIIREAIGDDTFFLAVFGLGQHLGIVDSNRISQDNMPVWDMQPGDPEDSAMSQQGFKPTVRTGARRYYFHDIIWINHPDLIVFRSNTNDETWPRVTLDEAQAFCTYVGLTGGIVKLGDRLVDLEADHINSIRKLLPIYGKAGRPLDLMEREFPETWHVHVDSSLDGYAESYHLLGLIHWGSNRDMTTNPYTKMEDTGEDRHFDIDLAGLGMDSAETYLAWEFWTETYLGAVTGNLNFDVPSHAGRVVALRKKTDAPQFLGWNRQITMGATDIQSMDWDGDAGTLTMKTKVARDSVKAPFTYGVHFFVPDEFTFQEATYAGSAVADAQETEDGKTLKLSFKPQETGEITIVMKFTKT